MDIGHINHTGIHHPAAQNPGVLVVNANRPYP